MNLNCNMGSIRMGTVSGDFNVSRGTSLSAPKSSFPIGGTNVFGVSKDRELARLRAQLDQLHSQIRWATFGTRLVDLMDNYLLLVAQLGETQAGGSMTPPLPSNRILSGVIAAVRQTTTGTVGPAVMGDNIGTPGHSIA